MIHPRQRTNLRRVVARNILFFEIPSDTYKKERGPLDSVRIKRGVPQYRAFPARVVTHRPMQDEYKEPCKPIALERPITLEQPIALERPISLEQPIIEQPCQPIIEQP